MSDYEKKYKEALEVAKRKLCFDKAGMVDSFTPNDIYEMFPELKESEDEKIRKWLISQLKIKSDDTNSDLNIMINKAITWLEKQGEQKPTDKIEPKFHEGDWVVKKDGELFSNGSHYARITDIDKEQYWLDSGTWIESKYIRLYNISDAKDGDVLNSPSNRLIWIYKDNEHYHACVNMNYVTDNVATDDLLSIPSDACPATKDEQTILFARMKESGYEWDAKLKQLRKIENETEIPFGAKDSELQEATYYIPKGFYAEIDDDKVVIKKGEKPTAWSEEDEMIALGIEQIVNCASLLNIAPDKLDKVRNWLKSLKDRVDCEANYTTTKEWKPSDEQMTTLRQVISGCSYDIEPLVEMEEHLKKLMEG